MTVEQRLKRLERLLLIVLVAACIGVGAFAATRSSTIRADRIITGPKGLWFEGPDGGTGARISASQVGGAFEIFGPDLKSSFCVSHNPHGPGGQLIIRGEEGGPAVLLTRDLNGGVIRLFTLKSERRATLETLPAGGIALRAWSGDKGAEEAAAQWP